MVISRKYARFLVALNRYSEACVIVSFYKNKTAFGVMIYVILPQKPMLHVTLFILIDYPLHVDRISMDLSISYFYGTQVEISKL